MKKLIIFLISLNILCINAYAGIGYMLNTPIQPMGIATSNTNIENNGFMIATGDAMGWDDVAYQNIISSKATGTGSLTLTTITGNIQGYSMADGQDFFGNGEMNHEWCIGTPVSAHLHVLNKTLVAADRFVKYVLEYGWADISGNIVASYTSSNNYTIPANTPVNNHRYIELLDSGYIPPVSIVSSQMVFRVSRVTATGTAPAADPVVLNFGVHGFVDTLGSRKEYLE